MQAIPPEQVIGRIKAENPWWSGAASVGSPYSDWVPRPHLELLQPLLENATVAFCEDHGLDRMMVTTRTHTGTRALGRVTLHFQPASLYCFLLGYNILHNRMSLEVTRRSAAISTEESSDLS